MPYERLRNPGTRGTSCFLVQTKMEGSGDPPKLYIDAIEASWATKNYPPQFGDGVELRSQEPN